MLHDKWLTARLAYLRGLEALRVLEANREVVAFIAHDQEL
jgi:hypothetical protein